MLPPSSGNGNTSRQDLFRARPAAGQNGEESGCSSLNDNEANNLSHMTDNSRNNNNRGNRLPFGSASSGGGNNNANYWKSVKNKKNSDCEEPDDKKVLVESDHIQARLEEESERVRNT